MTQQTMTTYRHTYAVTGAAGFIGTNLAYYLSEALAPDERIVLIDKLTYAGDVYKRQECTLTELTQSLLVDEWLEVLVREVLDLLDLVRCAEAVEEVDERYAALDRCEVCYSSEVHNLLYRTRAELCETRHTSTHHVLVITKDRERLRCDRTSSYVVDAWE